MTFKKIDKPQWLIDNEEPLLTPEQEAKARAQEVVAHYGADGESFPCLRIYLGFTTFQTPGLGYTLNISVSLKESEDSYWKKCSLPDYLAEDFLELYKEVLAKRPN